MRKCRRYFFRSKESRRKASKKEEVTVRKVGIFEELVAPDGGEKINIDIVID
jgi:hypothetical protein